MFIVILAGLGDRIIQEGFWRDGFTIVRNKTSEQDVVDNLLY